MASFNKVILAGNLTRDPQLSYTPSNTPVCQFGMAINRKWKGPDGQQKEEVCYVDLSAFGRQAEVINQYMTKGRPILVEGQLRYRQWTDKEGNNRNKLDVFVTGFTFLGSREGGGQRSEGGGQRSESGYGGQRSEGGAYGAPREGGGGYGAQQGGSRPMPQSDEPMPSDEPPPLDDMPGEEHPEIPF